MRNVDPEVIKIQSKYCLELGRKGYSPCFVNLTDEEYEYAKNAGRRIAKAKANDPAYRNDKSKINDRFATGLECEAAVLKFLGLDVCELESEVGRAKEYNHPDLRHVGIEAGVKGSMWGNSAVLLREEDTPQIVVIKRNKNTYIICGIAMPGEYEQYLEDKYIKDPAILRENRKSGFAAYDKLYKIYMISQAENMINIDRVAFFEKKRKAIEKMILSDILYDDGDLEYVE